MLHLLAETCPKLSHTLRSLAHLCSGGGARDSLPRETHEPTVGLLFAQVRHLISRHTPRKIALWRSQRVELRGWDPDGAHSQPQLSCC